MKGDLIYVSRTIDPQERACLIETSSFAARGFAPLLRYRHYGIDAGDGTVVHFTCTEMFSIDASIQRTSMAEFLDEGFLEIDEMVEYEYTSEEILQRALSQLDTNFGGYNFFSNNCEHFANWCATGKRYSRQVGFLNDDRDIVYKAIDNMLEPWVWLGGIIDNLLGLE